MKEAVMESTAQYWRSVWLALEPYMRCSWHKRFPIAPRGGTNTTSRTPNAGAAADRRRVDL